MNGNIYRKGLYALLAVVVLCMMFFGFKLSNKNNDIDVLNYRDEDNIISDNLIQNEVVNMKELEESIIETITVDIDGAVVNPGIYELNFGSRVNDVILKAGGLLVDAETKYINRARILDDGEKIYIRTIDENYDDEIIGEETNSKKSNGKININVASKEELMTLNGIGDSYAQRIIDYRENKKFSSIEEIKNISGIGEKTFEKIKDYIMVKN